MGKIVAIGGGEIGNLETLPIDKKIVRLVGKKRPRVLFVPTAGNDAERYCDTFKKIYGDKLKCRVDFLLLVREKLTKKEISDKILSADIIYVGGGDTLKMLQVWRKQGIDRLLEKAYKKDIILTGLSAGAICWFAYGVSDAVVNSNNKKLFGKIKCLNILQSKTAITLSPHHIRENKIREASIQEIMDKTPGVCLAVDDNAALFIQDNEYKIWHSKPNTKITKFFKKNKKVISNNLKERGSMMDLLSRD